MGITFGGMGLGSLLLLLGAIGYIFAGVQLWRTRNFDFTPFIVILIVYILGAVLFIWGITYYYRLLYRAWQTIQDKNARTTPQKAVGYLFIPFYNLYWIFVAYLGFAKDYNSFLRRMDIKMPALNENFFLAYCILQVLYIVPYVGALTAIPAFVLSIIICNSMIDAINNMVSVQNQIAVA